MSAFQLAAHRLAMLLVVLAKTELCESVKAGDAPSRMPVVREAAMQNQTVGNCSERFVGKYEYTEEGSRSSRKDWQRNAEMESRGKRSLWTGPAAFFRPFSSDAPWLRLFSSDSPWLRLFTSDSPWLRLFSSDSPWWRRLLRALDRAILADSVRIADGVFLVKEVHDEQGFNAAASEDEEREGEGEGGGAGLMERLLRRLILLLETHAVRVRMGTMASTPAPGEGGRIGGGHGYRHAFPLMVGSFALLAAFFVPLGFQLLAVVSGKALVLSQIAILVAIAGSIQRYLGMRGSYGPPSGVVQQGFHQHQGPGAAGVEEGYGYWHREDSNPEPLGPSRLQAYFTDAGTRDTSQL